MSETATATADGSRPSGMGALHPEDLAPVQRLGVPSAISADLLALPARGLDALLMSLVALVGVFFLWAGFARIEEVTTGSGRIVPASKLQVVQNLEGGIVREVFVREGATVAAGDTLLRIDPTQAGSSLGEIQEKLDGLTALSARLEAEMNDTAPVFSSDIASRRSHLVELEQAHYRTRQNELQSAISVLRTQVQQRSQEILEVKDRIETMKRALVLAQEQLELMRPLVASKAASRAEILAIEGRVNDTAGSLSSAELSLPRLEAAYKEAQDRIAEKLSAFRSDASQQLSSARLEAAVLAEQAKGTQDKLSRTTVKAPVSGIVKTVHITTPGQVVQPGQSLIEIVPMNDTLLVETRIKPSDIAFLHPGQRALVKLSAYDFSLYGGLEGEVEQIGADSITDDKGETYYLILVRTANRTLEHNGEKLQIIPGMVADVDVRTGEKTVLGYLMKPLTRMRHTALRER
ncbi:MAG: HlyD family type I secretion periplasmic adaptor subunit [Hyphomicrobium sp.]|nr:HlyD family type I secretion periplasmic adaptor subunit [Hyphomicrobium sp.]